jgi:hypothetical protein
MKYYELDTEGDGADEDLASVEELVTGAGYDEENYRVPRGKSTQAIWPADASLRIAKGGRRLSDLIGTTTSQVIVSRLVADIVRSALTPADNVEILPVTLRDSRRRILSKDYFVINPVGTVDCLDLEASEIEWDEDEPGEVIHLERPVLAAKKLTEPRSIFRLKEDPGVYVISSILAEPLRIDTTNLFWKALEVR